MPLKVFYIDDEKELCDVFVENFSNDRIEVEAFTDPELAINGAKVSPPDIIFIDYRLGAITADDVVGRLDPAIPKILVTGGINQNLKCTYTKVLDKPFDEKEVRAILQTYLGDN